jgi:hypothetical protein
VSNRNRIDITGISDADLAAEVERDFVHYIYEAAMAAVFVNYSEWQNSRPWNQ